MSAKTHILRQDDPPRSGRVLELRKVKAHESFVCAVCSIHWIGFPTHYLDKKTIPHVINRKDCLGCQQKRRIGWYGFLHCCNPEGKGGFVLQITAESTDYLIRARGDRPNLRGLVLTVSRSKGHLKSPVAFEYYADFSDRFKLPAPYDPTITMSRIWGVEL